MYVCRKSNVPAICLALVAIIFMTGSLFSQSKDHSFVLDGYLEESFPLKSGGLFSIENVNGSIEIESWNKDEVNIEVREKGRDRDAEIKIEVRVREGRVQVVTQFPRRFFKRNQSSAHYRIKVPKSVEIDAETTNGRVEVVDITGDVKARSTNGKIYLTDIEGDVDGYTTNGSVEIRDVDGEVLAETTNSSISLRNIVSYRIRARTTNGGIKADFDLDNSGDYDFHTTNGSVTVYIPKDSKVDLDANCRGRNFSTDFDITYRGGSRSSRRNSWSTSRVRGEINGGGAQLKLGTTNGRISVRMR